MARNCLGAQSSCHLGMMMCMDLSVLAAPAVAVASVGLATALKVVEQYSRKRLDLTIKAREAELARELATVESATVPYSGEDEMQYLRQRIGQLEKRDRSLNLKTTALLDVYHRQGLAQSRVSFWFSILLGTAGFIVIVYAVITRAQATSLYISGAVTEAVSVLFYSQSNQARKTMTESFDRARDDRRLEEALALASAMQDTTMSSGLKAVMALELIRATTPASVLRGFQPAPSNGAGQRE